MNDGAQERAYFWEFDRNCLNSTLYKEFSAKVAHVINIGGLLFSFYANKTCFFWFQN